MEIETPISLNQIIDAVRNDDPTVLVCSEPRVLCLIIAKLPIDDDYSLLAKFFRHYQKEIIGAPNGLIRGFSQIKALFETLKDDPKRFETFTKTLIEPIFSTFENIDGFISFYKLLKENNLEVEQVLDVDKVASLIHNPLELRKLLAQNSFEISDIKQILKKLDSKIFRPNEFQLEQFKELKDDVYKTLCEHVASIDVPVNFCLIPFQIMNLDRQQMLLETFREKYKKYFTEETFSRFSHHAYFVDKRLHSLLLELFDDKLQLLKESQDIIYLFQNLSGDCIATALSKLTDDQLLTSFPQPSDFQLLFKNFDQENLNTYFQRLETKISSDQSNSGRSIFAGRSKIPEQTLSTMKHFILEAGAVESRALHSTP